MGADYSFELISIETYGPQCIGLNKFFLGTVDRIIPMLLGGEGFAYIPPPIWWRGRSLLPLVPTALCSILLISIRLSSFDLLHFGQRYTYRVLQTIQIKLII